MPLNNQLIIGNSDLVQSRYTYMQAAGSTHDDGSTEGIHLRWELRGTLGDNHIPKGSLLEIHPEYDNTERFNKGKDVVVIYKVLYKKKYQALIDFLRSKPDRIDVISGEWEFDIPVSSITETNIITTIIIRFSDINTYYNISIDSNYDQYNDPYNFLIQYAALSSEGFIEVEAKDKLSFSVSMGMKFINPSIPGTNKVEAISNHYEPVTNPLYISCRKIFNIDPPSIPPEPEVEYNTVTAENIKYVRFRYENLYLCQVVIETYYDYITGVNYNISGNWEKLGEFGLTDVDSVAFNRLDNANWQVNNNWPRFRGDKKVVIDNYKEKWKPYLFLDDDSERIKDGVIKYMLNSSSSNPTAELSYPYDPQDGETSNTNPSQMKISYLDMLRFVSLDYHIARMLGLGHIDAIPEEIGEKQFVYLMYYKTLVGIEDNDPPQEINHFYMTLPTSKTEQFLPSIPILSDLKYGLEVPGLPPIQITNPEGYLPYNDIRYIRIFRESVLNELPFVTNFFASSNEFCSKGKTDAVFYGIEYREQTDPESTWSPSLSIDHSFDPVPFVDDHTRDEVIPLPNPSTNNIPVFIHEETNPGFHEYTLYAINWFSRASEICEPVETNETIFTINSTLLPPSNLVVQLIQLESPRIFTTEAEQIMLSDLLDDDSQEVLVRATFIWNHVQNTAFQFNNDGTPKLVADKVQFFFKAQKPEFTRGKIISVEEFDPIDDRVSVKVGPYEDDSTSPVTIVTPVIISGANYKNFVADGKSYKILNINDPGTGEITFIINKIYEYNFQDPPNPPNFPVRSEIIPEPSTNSLTKYFSIAEDLSDVAFWDAQIKEIDIVSFETNLNEDGSPSNGSHVYTETVTGIEGVQEIKNIGGIFEWATITELEDKSDGETLHEIPLGSTPVITPLGDYISGSHTGIYEIVFDTYQLSPHPDNNVEWYMGTARIKINNINEKKVLDVIDIITSGSTLTIIAVDSSFEVNQNYNPILPNYNPIVTGHVCVNFHPGYKVYFTKQPNFGQPQVLPIADQEMRQTYIAARATDSTLPEFSNLTLPVCMIALKIIKPQTPCIPTGPAFATRPDFYGKSTYTFDTEVSEDPNPPNALIFYRADERSILDKLYLHDTVLEIIENIKLLPPEQAIFINDFWKILVNVNVYTNDDLPNIGTHNIGEFKVYPSVGSSNEGTFQFPVPNNDNYTIPGTTVKPFNFSGTLVVGEINVDEKMISLKQIVKDAIAECFVPLTEEPVLYNQLKIGNQTSNAKPKIKDSNGRRLSYNADTSLYWQAPMSVKIPDVSKVRFTDYKLDGSSNSLYFYFSLELTNRMQFWQRSEIAGPIRLINSLPPEKPQIKKVTSQLANSVLNIPTAVKFEINNYLPADNVCAVKLYRTTNAVDSKSIRTMKLVNTFEQDLQANPQITFADIINNLQDDFSDLQFSPPYGDPLFYRLVALRKIKNEQGFDEYIPSEPSDIILSSVVDVLNPEAPALSYEASGIDSNNILPDVVLKWEKTAYNGKYYLYKMNSSGNWVLVDTFRTNDSHLLYEIGNLSKKDEDDNTLYYRYRVKVENSSGLFNLTEKELTI